MALASRSSPRLLLKLDLSTYLAHMADEKQIRCLGVDVSSQGLGIVGFDELAPKTAVVLKLKAKKVNLEVIWVKRDTTRQNVFHLGLKTVDAGDDLVSLLENEGLIEKQQRSVADTATKSKSGSTKRDLHPENFPDLIKIMANLHTADHKLLAGEFESFASTHKAYPINANGISFAVLVPSSIRPAKASLLSEDELRKQVIVMKNESGTYDARWVKAWPN